jgi:lipopolysaccharide export system protein LptA
VKNFELHNPDHLKRTALPLLIVIGILFLSSTNVFAQKKVEILKSDRLEGGKLNGQNIRKLIGHVILRHKGQTLYCDSAYQFISKNELRAYGNIEIMSDTLKIWADTAFYNTDNEISQFYGQVIINNKDVTIFSRKATYYFQTDKAIFPGKIRLEDKKGTLTADNGIYYNKTDSAIFKGNVQIADSTQYAEADSLFSNRKSDYYELHGRVFIRDEKNNSSLKGDYIQADSSGYRQLDGHAFMERIKKDKKDTNFVWANTIHYWKHDTTYIFKAYGNVHMWSTRFSSISDTSSYADSTEKFVLRSNAKAWYKHLQLTAPVINIKLKKDTIRSLLAYPHPFAVREDSMSKRLNQIKGDTIYSEFKKGDISSILVYPHGELLYYTLNNNKKPDGAIQMTADSVYMIFNEGAVQRVKAVKNINGNYLSESKDIAKQRLKGFIWTPKLRPHKPLENLKRRLPAIPDSRPFPLPERYKNFLEKHRTKTLSKTKPRPIQHVP